MTNPFGDIEREVEEAVRKQLSLVREIDRMEVDVTSWEASFLDSVIKQLEQGKPLSQKQLDVIHQMCHRYEVDFDL